MSLALFDMDGTIIDGDTNDISFHQYLAQGLIDKSVIDKLNYFEDLFYKGVLDINEFVRFAVTPLLNFTKEKRDLVLDNIVKNNIYPKVRLDALKQIKFHKDRGDTVVIVTSTMDYLVEVVARYLKVEYYLGAPMEQRDGRLTGKQAGIVPFQQDKITCVKEFAMQHHLSLEGAYGYGDSVNDIPMLSICEHKFAVNPNQKLLEHEFIKDCRVLNWG